MQNGAVSLEHLPRRRVGVVAAVALSIFVLDVISKVIAVATLEGRDEPVRILGGAVYLQLLRNPGAAFSMATGMTWVLALIAIAVVIAISWVARRLRSAGWAVGLGMVLAGALGNLVDRIFRAPSVLQGHVVDFISVFAPDGEVWPVFNVADSAIVVGGVLIVVLTLLGKEFDGTSAKERPADEPSVDGGAPAGSTTPSAAGGADE